MNLQTHQRPHGAFCGSHVHQRPHACSRGRPPAKAPCKSAFSDSYGGSGPINAPGEIFKGCLVCHRAPGLTRLDVVPAVGQHSAQAGVVYSGGVPVHRKPMDEMMNQVSQKTFKCTQCGKCCSFLGDSEVWVSPEEVTRMAGHLGITPQAFMLHYTQPTDLSGWRMLEAKQPGEGSVLTGDVCVFLDPQSLQCTVHTVRPLQCSTFPWWPELMYPRVWQHTKETLCEGLDHPEAGPLDVLDAAQQLDEATEHVLLLDAAMPTNWAEQHYDSPPDANDT